MTPAELAKKDEFYSIYWSEYNLVKGKRSIGGTLVDLPIFLDN